MCSSHKSSKILWFLSHCLLLTSALLSSLSMLSVFCTWMLSVGKRASYETTDKQSEILLCKELKELSIKEEEDSSTANSSHLIKENSSKELEDTNSTSRPCKGDLKTLKNGKELQESSLVEDLTIFPNFTVNLVPVDPRDDRLLPIVYGEQLLDFLPLLARKVYSLCGPSHPESLYQSGLCEELLLRGVRCWKEVPIHLAYKQDLKASQRRMDLFLETQDGFQLVVECKAQFETLTRNNAMQLMMYLDLTGIEEGALINFPRQEGLYPSHCEDYEVWDLYPTPSERGFTLRKQRKVEESLPLVELQWIRRRNPEKKPHKPGKAYSQEREQLELDREKYNKMYKDF